jgi:class 3 adenylate cyclase
MISIEGARYLARSIPGAKLVELPGDDHLPMVGDSNAILEEVQQFLTGARNVPAEDRIVTTLLFADIVRSTELAGELGDSRWLRLLESYYQLVHRQLERFRGHEIDTAGDGLFATFDGPARGVRCAQAISENANALGIDVRAGLHTGEVEIIGDKVGGVAVHIGARVAALAGAREVLVSRTVKDLIAGSGIRFNDHGTHALKGVEGEWQLFLAAAS